MQILAGQVVSIFAQDFAGERVGKQPDELAEISAEQSVPQRFRIVSLQSVSGHSIGPI